MSEETLFPYLAVFEHAISALLVSQRDKNAQRPVYYVSKAFIIPETRYPPIKKLALALLIATRKPRPYCQSHTIVVLTNSPLRQILHKLELAGRLVKWSIELNEFDIEYQP